MEKINPIKAQLNKQADDKQTYSEKFFGKAKEQQNNDKLMIKKITIEYEYERM